MNDYSSSPDVPWFSRPGDTGMHRGGQAPTAPVQRALTSPLHPSERFLPQTLHEAFPALSLALMLRG